MNYLTLNLLLALAWAMMTGTFSLFSLASGFALGFLVLWALSPLLGGDRRYFLKFFYWVRLAVMFLYELVVSSVAVIWDVLTPTQRSDPVIFDMPLSVRSDAGILLVTNLISLTPGTLSLDVAPDRSSLRVHAMFGGDPEAVCAQLKGGMERWVRDAIE